MSWLVYLIIHVITFSTKDLLRKRSLNRFDNMAVMSLEFAFAFMFVALGTWWFGVPLVFNKYSLIFVGLGLVQGLGTMGKINAMNISLSKTILISKYNVLFPVILGALFLGELSLLNIGSVAGLLRLMALLLFPFSLYFLQNTDHQDQKKVSMIWMLSMAQFLFFHAGLDFLIKLSIQPEHILQAEFFQRLTLVGVAVVAAVFTKAKYPAQKQLYGVSIFNGLLISISTFTSLSALAIAPLVIFKPLQKTLTVFVTAGIGMFVFHEHKQISRKAALGYILSAIGVFLLLSSEIISAIG